MKKMFVPICFVLSLFSNSAYSENDVHEQPTSKLKVTGAVIAVIGILGTISKDSGGSQSSASYEMKKASPLIALAGVSLFVIGQNRESKLSLSYRQSQPVLSFVHKF